MERFVAFELDDFRSAFFARALYDSYRYMIIISLISLS
jgi:hypothetical protein